jgi:hypothetical protein
MRGPAGSPLDFLHGAHGRRRSLGVAEEYLRAERLAPGIGAFGEVQGRGGEDPRLRSVVHPHQRDGREREEIPHCGRSGTLCARSGSLKG